MRSVSTRTAALIRTPAGATFSRAVLDYTEQDPFAVRVSIVGADTFVFGRDLLVDSFAGPAGEGDVRLMYDGDNVHVSATTDTGWARMHIPAAAVQHFLDSTYELVPAGSEQVDVDGMLKALAG